MDEQNIVTSSIDAKFLIAKEYAANAKAAFIKFKSVLPIIGTQAWVQPETLKKLDELIGRLDKIEKELANPTLKIAMVGTTSSGKSTLLNAMIGRMLVPVEAGEMSAGVVSIRHDDKLSMHVQETLGMTWSAGNYDVHSDREIYAAMRDQKTGIMALYRSARDKAKNNQTIMAPRIDITASLAPKCGGIPNFDFPDALNLEFIDLPGVRSENDKKNLEVIQQYLANAFLIVVLSYSDTNTENRENLLKNIYETVIAVCKNKEAVLFIMNKVDQRSDDDNSLEERCAEVANAIQNKLGLKNKPQVIPISARPLFHIQVAFGVYGPEKNMEAQDPYIVAERLKKFHRDCQTQIYNMKQSSPQKKAWLKEHDEDSEWSPEDIFQLLTWVYEESNINSIWNGLKLKLRDQLGAILIKPIFGNFFNEVESLISALNDQKRILGLNTYDEIENEKNLLAKTLQEMKDTIENFKHALENDLQSALYSVQAVASSVTGSLMNNFFMDQRDTMRDIRGELINTIAVPVLDYLSGKNSNGLPALEDELKKFVSSDLARKVTTCVSKLQGAGYSNSRANAGYSGSWKKSEKDSNDEYKESQAMKKWLLALYFEMKQAFVKRGEYLLQLHIYDFSDGIQKMLQVKANELYNKLVTVVGNKHGMLRPYVLQDFNVDVKLPENVFLIPEEIAQAKFTQQESYTDVDKGSCFDSTVTLQRDVDMVGEKLPSAEQIKTSWEDGIQNGENVIWGKMLLAIENITSTELNRISENLVNNAAIIEGALNSQFERLKQDKQSLIKCAEASLLPINKVDVTSRELQTSLGGDSDD